MKNLKTYSHSETSIKKYIEFIAENAIEITKVNDLKDKNLDTNGNEMPPKPFIKSGGEEDEEETTFQVYEPNLQND